MIIGTCGFCSTGSSAVSDYLKEFEENQVLDSFEFTIPYLPDGLEDLDYHLNERPSRIDSGECAIVRFRRFMKAYGKGMSKLSSLTTSYIENVTEKFLSSITQIKWKFIGRSDIILNSGWLFRKIGLSIMAQRFIPFLNKKMKKCVDIWPVRELEVSIQPDNFEEESKKFIQDILKGMGADFSKNIVLDQPFSGDDPVKSFKYFDNPLAIVVDRDPRDNYLFAKKFLYKKGRLMPTDTVEEFVKYYKLVRENRPYKENNNQVMCLHFEDMVYNYEKTTKRIQEFCGLQKNPKPFSVFDPGYSVANTQLYKKYPEYKKDIDFIEKNLSEYLFDFDSFQKPKSKGGMFCGKSPLNNN